MIKIMRIHELSTLIGISNYFWLQNKYFAKIVFLQGDYW